MGKLFLAAVVALALALYFPQTRPVVMDQVRPALNPILGWATNGEMETIGRDLVTFERTYFTMPRNQVEFSKWLEGRYQVEESTFDSWGQPYALQVWPDSFAVISSGPDATLGTEDDLMHTSPRAIPSSGRRRR